MIPQNVKKHHSLPKQTTGKDRKKFKFIFFFNKYQRFFFQKFILSVYRVLTRTKLHKTVDDISKCHKTPFTWKTTDKKGPKNFDKHFFFFNKYYLLCYFVPFVESSTGSSHRLTTLAASCLLRPYTSQ